MCCTCISGLIDRATKAAPRTKVKLVAARPQVAGIPRKSGSRALAGLGGPARSSAPVICVVEAKAPGRAEFEVPSRADMIAYIRARVGQFASDLSFSIDEIEDIKLAVGEASANALRHGGNPRWCKIGVRMQRVRNGIRVCVSDKGCGFDPDAVCPPAPGSLVEGGRGIMFMRMLMDEVCFRFTNPGTCVELAKYCRRSA